MRLTVKPCHSVPMEIKHHSVSNRLEIHFDNGSIFILPSEYLRVYTPSAEAVGHGPGQETLQIGKQHVTIKEIRQVGSYAICLVFSDGHDSGLYTWDFLHKLGLEYEPLWADYLHRLKAAGLNRDGSPHIY